MSIYKSLARAEALAAAQRDELPEVILAAYQRAVEDEDAEGAALYARKIRNKLLESSDKSMALDRIGLEAPNGTTFSAWQPFLRGLGDVLGGDWATYRQSLRDLPEQPGFPFTVEFPQSPDKSNG